MATYLKKGAYYISFQQTREWSSCSWKVNDIYQECDNGTKIERRGNAHKGTLQVNGYTEITGSDLTEKKLFFFTDSTVVKAWKGKNKVAIQCFPWYPYYLRKWGGGEGCVYFKGSTHLISGLRSWCLFAGGHLWEHGHLFKEIIMVIIVALQEIYSPFFHL